MLLSLPLPELPQISHHLNNLTLDHECIDWLCGDEGVVVSAINQGGRFCCWCGHVVTRRDIVIVHAQVLVENKRWHKGLHLVTIPFAFCTMSEYRRHINISRYGV